MKWPKSEEILNFEGMFGWVPMNPSPAKQNFVATPLVLSSQCSGVAGRGFKNLVAAPTSAIGYRKFWVPKTFANRFSNRSVRQKNHLGTYRSAYLLILPTSLVPISIAFVNNVDF